MTVPTHPPDEDVYPRDFTLLDSLDQLAPGSRAVEAHALRTRSRSMRAVLAHRATRGRLRYEDLVRRLRTAPGALPDDLSPGGLVALARVLALQTGDAYDMETARLLFAQVPAGRLKPADRLFYARLLETLGDATAAAEQLALIPANTPGRQYLELDLANPFTGGVHADAARWHAGWAELFTRYGLEVPVVGPGDDEPLDRLVVDAPPAITDGPLVTITVTTWRPGPKLLGALRSLADQSWRNLEILVVDDCSGPEYEDVLVQAEALDPRIRVLRQPVNGGTYLARNAALAVASGELVTGNDDDDWSHPRRIEHQVRAFLDDPTVTATRVLAYMVTADLEIDRIGQPVSGRHAATYMARRDILRRCGGFVQARKGADTELMRRVEAFTGQPVRDINVPLALYRLDIASLSRGEFGPGWHHPARAAFWASAARAHEVMVRDGLDPAEAGRAVVVPRRYEPVRIRPDRYDVAIAADWRASDAERHPVLDEVDALLGAGLRVGLVHLPDNRYPVRRRLEMHPTVQDLINARTVDRLLLDEDDVEVGTLVVAEAGLLQLPPAETSLMTVHRVLVLADQEPVDPAHHVAAYSVRDCTRNAERIFGRTPVWVPRDALVRSSLEAQSWPGLQLAPHDVPMLADPTRFAVPRALPRSSTPVVGQRADDRRDWPPEDDEVRRLYPADGSIDVRLLGSPQRVRAMLGRRSVPPGWLVYVRHELSAREYLGQLEFFVDESGPLTRMRTTHAAALASGAVLVVPEVYRPVYGDAAVYAAPLEVTSVVRGLHADPQAWLEQSRRGQAFAGERFSAASFLAALRPLLDSSVVAGTVGQPA